MSRVIVIDRCRGCPYNTGLINSNVCSRAGEHIASRYLDYDARTPDWCPLRPMPEKKWEPDETNSYEGGYADGWNDCLDAIEGVDR